MTTTIKLNVTLCLLMILMIKIKDFIYGPEITIGSIIFYIVYAVIALFIAVLLVPPFKSEEVINEDDKNSN